MKAPLKFAYDPVADIIVIEGISYSGDFFRELSPEGMPEGQKFVVAERLPKLRIERVPS